MKILGICGSLRKDSLNRSLLRAAQGLTPDGTTIDIIDLGDIPLFNEDVEAQGDPDPVQALKERIRATDAVLIATPEYNWGLPGALKNAFDWASRPAGRSVLKQKPVAMMGASTGPWGTTRAQLQLRQSLTYVDALALQSPWVYVAMGKEKFDGSGALSDERTRQQVKELVAALVAWTERLRPRA